MLITVDLDVDPALPGFEVVRISTLRRSDAITPATLTASITISASGHWPTGQGGLTVLWAQSPRATRRVGYAEKKLAKSQ